MNFEYQQSFQLVKTNGLSTHIDIFDEKNEIFMSRGHFGDPTDLSPIVQPLVLSTHKTLRVITFSTKKVENWSKLCPHLVIFYDISKIVRKDASKKCQRPSKEWLF